jgi:Predicted membrane protein
MIMDLFNKFKRQISFGIIGFINTGVDFLVFFLMTSVFGAGPGMGQAVSYWSGVLTSFILNRTVTFKDGQNKIWQQVLRFIIVNIVSYFVSTRLIEWIVLQGVNLIIAKVLVTGVVMVINYFGYKILVFGVKEKDEE